MNYEKQISSELNAIANTKKGRDVLIKIGKEIKKSGFDKLYKRLTKVSDKISGKEICSTPFRLK
jgi:hypothetical protein